MTNSPTLGPGSPLMLPGSAASLRILATCCIGNADVLSMQYVFGHARDAMYISNSSQLRINQDSH